MDHWKGGTKAAARAFRSAYLELWAKLMREAYAADQGLFDQHLLDRLSSLLIALNTWVACVWRGGLVAAAGDQSAELMPWWAAVWPSACVLPACTHPASSSIGRREQGALVLRLLELFPLSPLAQGQTRPPAGWLQHSSASPTRSRAVSRSSPPCLPGSPSSHLQLGGARVPLGGHPHSCPAGHRLDPRQPGAGGGAGHRGAPAGGRAAQEGRGQGGATPEPDQPACAQCWASPPARHAPLVAAAVYICHGRIIPRCRCPCGAAAGWRRASSRLPAQRGPVPRAHPGAALLLRCSLPGHLCAPLQVRRGLRPGAVLRRDAPGTAVPASRPAPVRRPSRHACRASACLPCSGANWQSKQASAVRPALPAGTAPRRSGPQ